MKLTSCRSCAGLLPRVASRCPHCDAPRPKGGPMRSALALAGIGAVSLTLMACSGAPCYTDERCAGGPRSDLSAGTDAQTTDLTSANHPPTTDGSLADAD